MSTLKTVFLFQQQLFNWTLVPLARALKRRFNSKVYLQVNSKESKKDFLKRGGGEVFSEIFIYRSGYEGLFLPVESEERKRIIQKARSLEEMYGFRAMRDIIQDDRHLGIGFMRGGPYHPRSWFSRAGNRYTTLRLLLEQFKYYEQLCDDIAPDLILGGGGGFSGKPLALIARRRKIALRTLFSSRHKDFWYFAENEYGENSKLENAFDKSRNDFTQRSPIVPFTASKMKGGVLRGFRFIPTLRRAAGIASRQLYYKMRRYDKAKSYFVLENLKLIFRQNREAARVRRYARTKLSDLTKQPFIFFPLQTEPEATLTTYSPEFTDQIFALREIALNLPTHTLLATKEHVYSIGRRPMDFYKHLMEIPNLVFLDANEDGLDVVKRSIGVATVSSTAGQEAAVLGIPVISFGQHNLFNFLDHVHVVKGWDELPNLVELVCRERSQTEIDRSRMDGSRFLAALESICMDMEKMNIYRDGFGQRPEASDEEAEKILNLLLESLESADQPGGWEQ